MTLNLTYHVESGRIFIDVFFCDHNAAKESENGKNERNLYVASSARSFVHLSGGVRASASNGQSTKQTSFIRDTRPEDRITVETLSR